MTDSTDPKRDNSKAAILARLHKYNKTHGLPREKENISDLPRWVKTALVMKAVDGMSYNDAAARMSKSGHTLEQYAKSPAAKKWLESLVKFLDDPIEVAKAYLRGNALSITLERMAFLEAAINAGDYSEGDKIARDLQDRLGIVAKKADTGPSTVVVHLAGASLEIPLGDSKVIDAEFEMVKKDE